MGIPDEVIPRDGSDDGQRSMYTGQAFSEEKSSTLPEDTDFPGSVKEISIAARKQNKHTFTHKAE